MSAAGTGAIFEPDFQSKTLWRIAVLSARLRGYGIGHDCAFHLQQFIQGGVGRLKAERRASDPLQLLKAAWRLDSLVAEMAREAKAHNLTELRERTFFAAIRKLCPLYPFC